MIPLWTLFLFPLLVGLIYFSYRYVKSQPEHKHSDLILQFMYIGFVLSFCVYEIMDRYFDIPCILEYWFEHISFTTICSLYVVRSLQMALRTVILDKLLNRVKKLDGDEDCFQRRQFDSDPLILKRYKLKSGYIIVYSLYCLMVNISVALLFSLIHRDLMYYDTCFVKLEAIRSYVTACMIIINLMCMVFINQWYRDTPTIRFRKEAQIVVSVILMSSLLLFFGAYLQHVNRWITYLPMIFGTFTASVVRPMVKKLHVRKKSIELCLENDRLFHKMIHYLTLSLKDEHAKLWRQIQIFRIQTRMNTLDDFILEINKICDEYDHLNPEMFEKTRTITNAFMLRKDIDYMFTVFEEIDRYLCTYMDTLQVTQGVILTPREAISVQDNCLGHLIHKHFSKIINIEPELELIDITKIAEEKKSESNI